MTDHYVALLSWNVREHWPELAPKGPEGQPAHPYAYGSCHEYFPALAKKQPVLWVVASPDYGPGSKRLPPTRGGSDVIVGGSPFATAQRLARWWNTRGRKLHRLKGSRL